jgi:hypothetical protein
MQKSPYTLPGTKSHSLLLANDLIGVSMPVSILFAEVVAIPPPHPLLALFELVMDRVGLVQ